MRLALLSLGWLCVALAAAGVVLPVLPTTPFLLVAAGCFARGSERVHAWLLRNRTFGPMIRAWQDQRAIPRRAKGKAVAVVLVTFACSLVFGPSWPWLRALMVLLGGGLVTFLVRLPVVDDEVPPPVPASAAGPDAAGDHSAIT